MLKWDLLLFPLGNAHLVSKTSGLSAECLLISLSEALWHTLGKCMEILQQQTVWTQERRGEHMLLFLKKNNDFTCSLHTINYTKIQKFSLKEAGGEASVPSLHSYSQASAVCLRAGVGGTQTKPKWTKALFSTCCLEFHTIEATLSWITYNLKRKKKKKRFCTPAPIDLRYRTWKILSFFFFSSTLKYQQSEEALDYLCQILPQLKMRAIKASKSLVLQVFLY